VTEAAGLLPGGAANAAQQEGLTAALEAASIDPDAAAALQEGRLEKEIEAPSGFGELGGLTLVPDAEPEPDPAAEEEARKAEEAERRRRLEEAIENADREVEKAESEVARLEEQLERAGGKLQEARKRRAELEEPSRP
jgi:phage shock protein A